MTQVTDSNGDTIVRMRNVWEWAFKAFLTTGPVVLGAAWLHLSTMNAMLIRHDKDIARLMDKTGLHSVRVDSDPPQDPQVASTATPSAP